MKSIGYGTEKTYTKSELALIQLQEAIDLFVQEKYIPSITLAGSSEEVFAALLRAKGHKPIIEESYFYIEFLGKELGIQAFQNIKKEEAIKEWNHIRNRTKHHNKNENQEIIFNACDEAYWLIKRAIANSASLGVKAKNEYVFSSWEIEKLCL